MIRTVLLVIIVMDEVLTEVQFYSYLKQIKSV